MKQASLGHPAPLVKVGKSSSKEPSALSQLLGRPASRVHSSTSHTLPSQTLPHPDQPTKVSPTTSGRSKDSVWITVFFPPPNGEDPVSASALAFILSKADPLPRAFDPPLLTFSRSSPHQLISLLLALLMFSSPLELSYPPIKVFPLQPTLTQFPFPNTVKIYPVRVTSDL